MSETPLVTVCCLAYNHENFIRQCLDGFVMQKTNFPFIVIINDDASTDITADIIREYESKYPNIIKPIYQKENQYSQKKPILREQIFPKIQSKYLAMCEGDDYWTDEYKLQKQVDFMEANEDFSICFHHVNEYYEDQKIFKKNYPENRMNESYDLKKLAFGNFISTPSVMYRYNKQVFDDLNNFPVLGIGDYILHMLFAKYGKIMKLPDVMAVYRIHQNGIWSMKSKEHQISFLLKLLTVFINYFKDDQEVCAILNEQYRNNSIFLFPDIHKDKLTIDYNNLLEEYNKLLNSKSMRITKPLRKIFSIFKKRNDDISSCISSLKIFSKTMKQFGGKVYGEKILLKWNKNKNKKTILLISHDLYLTGAPIALYYFAEYLINKNYQTILISPKDGALRKLLSKINIPVIIYKNIYKSNILLNSSSLYNLIIINTIIGHSLVSLFNKQNIPILWWIHESFVWFSNKIKNNLPLKLNNNINVYCVGHHAENILRQFRHNYNINNLLYFIPDLTNVINKNIQINNHEKCSFAIIGTLEERKGQDILIQAIYLLPIEIIKKCNFIFVGNVLYKPFLQSVNKIVKEYPQNITYIDCLNRNEILKLYQQIDCLICSSRDDPMPIVVTEAMIFSKIIICSENTGSAKLLDEMKSGLIYKNNSSEELSKLIKYVIENKNNLSDMRENARKTYEKYFSKNVFEDSIKVILNKYLN